MINLISKYLYYILHSLISYLTYDITVFLIQQNLNGKFHWQTWYFLNIAIHVKTSGSIWSHLTSAKLLKGHLKQHEINFLECRQLMRKLDQENDLVFQKSKTKTSYRLFEYFLAKLHFEVAHISTVDDLLDHLNKMTVLWFILALFYMCHWNIWNMGAFTILE